MYNEIAFSLITLVKILFGVYFENEVAHLEPYRLYFLSYVFAWLLNVAKCFITLAIEFR